MEGKRNFHISIFYFNIYNFHSCLTSPFAQSNEGIVSKIEEFISPPKIDRREREKKLEPQIDIDSLSINEAISIALENSYTLRESEDELKRIKEQAW